MAGMSALINFPYLGIGRRCGRRMSRCKETKGEVNEQSILSCNMVHRPWGEGVLFKFMREVFRTGGRRKTSNVEDARHDGILLE